MPPVGIKQELRELSKLAGPVVSSPGQAPGRCNLVSNLEDKVTLQKFKTPHDHPQTFSDIILKNASIGEFHLSVVKAHPAHIFNLPGG